MFSLVFWSFVWVRAKLPSVSVLSSDLLVLRMFSFYFYGLFSAFLVFIFYVFFSLSYKAGYVEKSGPFECGFDPVGTARLHFCMKFFLLCVIFVIFDVEVALLLPIPFRSYVLSLLLVLLFGLFYEWFYGGLNWVYVNAGSMKACF